MNGKMGPFQWLGMILIVPALLAGIVVPGYAGLVVGVVSLLAACAIYGINHDGPSV
jgi:hypothetical protein